MRFDGDKIVLRQFHRAENASYFRPCFSIFLASTILEMPTPRVKRSRTIIRRMSEDRVRSDTSDDVGNASDPTC